MGRTRSESSPGVIRFFKILFGNDQSQILYLPRKFGRKVKHLKDQEAQIEDIIGHRWSVTVSRVNGSLAFKEGWQRFFQAHGLAIGQLLVFTYMGRSHFTVQIFTKNNLEVTHFGNEMPRQRKRRREHKRRLGVQRTSLEDEPYQTADVVETIPDNSGDNASLEITNFGNEMPRQRKRRREVQLTSLEDEPYQTADVDEIIPDNSGDKTMSANFDSPGNEFHRRETNLNVVVNADFAFSKPIPMPVAVNVEDPICTINRYDRCYEERRNLFYDLSLFEIENRTPDAKEIQKASIGVSDPPVTETAHHVVNSVDASDANMSFSCVGIVEPTKQAGDDAMDQTTTTMDDAEMTAIQTDINMGNSGDIIIKKFEKELNAKTACSLMEIADHITKEVGAKTTLSHEQPSDISVGIVEPSKPAGDDATEQNTTTMEDAEIGAAIQTDIIMDNIKKFEKELDAKTSFSNKEMADHITKEMDAKAAISHVEIVDQITKEVDTKTTLSHEQPSDNSVGIVEPSKPTGDDAMKQTTTIMDDAEIGAAIKTDLIMDISGDISIEKFEKELDTKTILSHKEPSDNSNMKKGMLDNVCNFQEGNNRFPESFSVSPSIGSNKIAEREDAPKRKFDELSVSSSAVKHPSGRPIKKELFEMEDIGKPIVAAVWNHACMISSAVQVKPQPEPSIGKPIVAALWNHASPPVKVKPEPLPGFNQSHEIGPSESDTISSFQTCPFSAQVKSRLYLELPVRIIKSARVKNIVVYLRGSTQRIWPVLCFKFHGADSFTVNWAKFCEHNNIKPGDICTFREEVGANSVVYGVQVTCGSD